jgi:hypothetical protein
MYDVTLDAAGSLMRMTIWPFMGFALLLGLINLGARSARIRTAALGLVAVAWVLSLGGLVVTGLDTGPVVGMALIYNAICSLIVAFVLWLGPPRDEPMPATK